MKLKNLAKLSKESVDLRTEITAIIKAESQILSNVLEREDGFTDSYGDNLIEPEISPEKYYSLVEQNNSLGQCISAMEVNIDGTGFDIVRSDKKEIADSEQKNIEAIKEFFDEVYPSTSLTSCRRSARRHLEISGYAGIEVIRNPKNEILFFRTLDSKNLRLQKLGKPISSKKELMRRGKKIAIDVQKRERVFVQLINNKKVYFKEFGSTRDLNKINGKWSDKSSIPAKDRASEIIYLTVVPSSSSAYGVPRWLSQLPSVIGSRAAEELNLEYFDSGGIPPILILVSGGQMAQEAKDSLKGLLSGKAKDKLRGLVADIHSTGGTVDKSSGVDVKVETFDSARQKDSMFENYDEKCERRIRASFRLPPLFVGKSDDYSYAAVFASYTLAEAQIFKPERDEFDEIFNATIMKDLTDGVYKIKSKALTVADATNKIKALEIATANKVITQNGLINELNSSSDLNIALKETDGELEGDVESNTTGKIGENIKVSKNDISYLGTLADSQISNVFNKLDDIQKIELIDELNLLTDVEKSIVNMLVANKLYASTDNDPEGMSELCACVTK